MDDQEDSQLDVFIQRFASIETHKSELDTLKHNSFKLKFYKMLDAEWIVKI